MCLQRKIWKDRLPCLIKYTLAPPSLPLGGDVPKREGWINTPLWPNPFVKSTFPLALQLSAAAPTQAPPLTLRPKSKGSVSLKHS